MKVTLKELAKEVDCDVSTVSRVLNNKPNRVSQKKRDCIFSVAKRMAYVVNRNGSNLASGKTRMIGVLVRSITDRVYAEYIEKIDRYMTTKGYSIVPFITYDNQDRERQCLMSLQSHQVDAMICLNYTYENEETYKRLQRGGGVLTFRGVDIKSSSIDFDTALIDIGNAYYHLANHLFVRKCQKIGIVGGYIADEIARGEHAEYSADFEQAHREAGLVIRPEQGVPCEISQDSAYTAVMNNCKKIQGVSML